LDLTRDLEVLLPETSAFLAGENLLGSYLLSVSILDSAVLGLAIEFFHEAALN
jgi:hypothetical protein